MFRRLQGESRYSGPKGGVVLVLLPLSVRGCAIIIARNEVRRIAHGRTKESGRAGMNCRAT